MMSMNGSQATAVAITDRAWFDHFRPSDRLTRVDEVNFWQPKTQNQFRAVPIGGRFFFRLKRPDYAVAGFGSFAHQTFLDVRTAWEVFGEKNGDPTFERFVRRIAEYNGIDPLTYLSGPQRPLSCLILRDAVFLPSDRWLPWEAEAGWGRFTITYQRYAFTSDPGRQLAALAALHSSPIPDLLPHFEPLAIDERTLVLRSVAEREGQGTFRVRLLDAYGNQCAVTGEHTRPVLDAAHIQPYRGPASNHIQNGLVLRTDLHRLYDLGYLTVTPDSYRLRVSERLRQDFHNGRVYYAMDGSVISLPSDPALRPSPAALDWHAGNVFR